MEEEARMGVTKEGEGKGKYRRMSYQISRKHLEEKTPSLRKGEKEKGTSGQRFSM